MYAALLKLIHHVAINALTPWFFCCCLHFFIALHLITKVVREEALTIVGAKGADVLEWRRQALVDRLLIQVAKVRMIEVLWYVFVCSNDVCVDAL